MLSIGQPKRSRHIDPSSTTSDRPALDQIRQRIQGARRFSDIMPDIEVDVLALLKAERITIYQRSRNRQEILSRYTSSGEQIRLALSTGSIAGYVALSQQPLLIADVHDSKSLNAIHPSLKYDPSYDRRSGFQTHSMVVVPIKHNEVLLGVLQIINHRDGGCFDPQDLYCAQSVAEVLGQKFRHELQGTDGPYALLMQQSKISEARLDELTQRSNAQQSSLTKLLISEALISPEEVGESLERYYQVPYMAFDASIEPPPALFLRLSEAYLRRQLWVPVSGNQEEVTILIHNPNDHSRIMEIEGAINAQRYVFRVGLEEDILRYLDIAYGHHHGSGANLHDLVGQLTAENQENVEGEAFDGGFDENEATVIKLVNEMVMLAHQSGASDLHIEPAKGNQAATARVRVDGVCRLALEIPASHIRAVVARLKIMARMDITERRKPQDGKCVIKIRNQTLELRIATIPTVHGECAVIRLLAASAALPVDKLNLSERNKKECLRLIERPHGVFLVVGPTGSGKTTTLHAMLGHINVPEKKIWTAEDPVEITQPGLQQVQTNAKIGFNFAAALRAFLRADPDVIMIGEIRDAETAQIAVEASLTGHLVMSTLHTNSASETVARLLDLGVHPANFSDALLGVLAQRLVRTLCEACKTPYKANAKEFVQLAEYYGLAHFPELGVTQDTLHLHKAVGCDVCGGTGYKGRTGIHELLVADEGVKKHIFEHAGAMQIREAAIQGGMRTLQQDGIAKIISGQTDYIQLRKAVAE